MCFSIVVYVSMWFNAFNHYDYSESIFTT